MLYKMSEWESSSGWHCGCIDDLTKGSNVWYLPARILNMTPAAYMEWVIKEYKPDYTYFSSEKCLFFFSWKSQEKERAFKNFINKKARERNFQI